MIKIFSVEFLKLKRAKMMLLVITISILPAVIKFLQYTFQEKQNMGWQGFLTSNQEVMVFTMLTVVILISSFIFTMDYEYNTEKYIFTTRASIADIFIAKLITLFLIIAFLFIISAVSELLFGFMALKFGISGSLFIKLIKVIIWYVFSYFLVSLLIVLISVLTKKFILSAVIPFGYLVMTMPFHLKNNLYACPFMTPVAAASKMYNSTNYIFTNYYKGQTVNYYSSALFLAILGIVSFSAGLYIYKKQEILK